ncbi:tuftelin-interacting protein 11-like [Sycon ciliatum]|uniref:tuftelin-interacting protein 11-like n=1 Tax=Sycon ciliatum TaxID=27933 RepID=UPI0031F6B55C
MSSDEMESFGVSQEDLEDINDQMSAYGRKGRFSKEKAIYGLWADHDSDEDHGSSRRRGGKADYSRPLNFISGGVKGGQKEGDAGSDSDPERMDEQLLQSMEIAESEKAAQADDASASGLPKAFVSSSQQKAKTLETIQGSRGNKSSSNSRLGMKPMGKHDKAFGSWEKHTKGIGLKLLQKFGYEAGTGLGRGGEGINQPIEVKVRGGRGALAYYGTERTKQVMVDSEDEKEERVKEELRKMKRTEGEGKQRKTTYVYRTADEVRASGVKQTGKRVPAAKKTDEAVKVVDMTGPEERVYHGYDSIHSKHSHPDGQPMLTESVGFLPELLHNVQLLADQAESEILHIDRQLQHEQNRIINLRHEREMLSKTLQKERQELDRVSEVKDVLTQLTERSQPNSNDPLSLSECASTFSRLQSHFEHEYISYGLSRLAVPVVFPLIKKNLTGWEPFGSLDVDHLELFTQWKSLLNDSSSSQSNVVPSEDSMPVFDRLLWEVWMPVFRSAMTKWSPRAPHHLIAFLEQWTPVLPGWINSHLLDTWVFPRLQAEVEKWSPTTDAQPIDSWIHPWLELMGHRLEPLYAPVRHTLAAALSKWDPSDASAKAILMPWVGVFSQGSMDAFIIRCIVPKLATCLQTRLVINPAHQDMEAFRWVMAWRSIVPLNHFADMMDKFFFQRWMSVLTQWLQPASNPNYEEVIQWFSGWKEQFDQELQNHPQIARHFNHAVEVMHHMVSHPAGGQQPASAGMTYAQQAHMQDTADASASQSYQRMSAAAAAPPVLDFKEVVQRKIQEMGLSFLPDRMHDSHMLYRVGRCSIYFSHNVIFCRVPGGGAFQPVSLDQLLSMAA